MTLQSAFCATLVDEFYRGGVRHAILAPGSRSSPLAIALLEDGRIDVHVRLDERSGAFFALGAALGSKAPVLMLTTSGTAAAEVHPAVVEADLARVPLVICTADRPPELHTVGAPQTIDQTHLYGRSVRYFANFGIPDEHNRPGWRSLASRLVGESQHSARGPGPVHANLAFREPLVGPDRDQPAGRASEQPWHVLSREPAVSSAEAASFAELLAGASRGLFLVGGGGSTDDGVALLSLAESLGWPVLTDGRGFRRVPHSAVIAHADLLLRSPELKEALEPDLVVHLGSPHASRVLSTWCAGLGESGCQQVLVDPYAAFEDPERVASRVIVAPVDELLAKAHALMPTSRPTSWLSAWRSAEDAAEKAIALALDEREQLSEPGIARRVVELAPEGAALFCSSSMPIRDLEWFAPAHAHAPQVFANRGANGIDGVISTTLGLAASFGTSRRVIGLLGDLAFFHDLSGLVWGQREAIPEALLVVIDNNGGGIFSFLGYPDQLDETIYERAFGTPQGPDIAAVAQSLGAVVREAATPKEFDEAYLELVEQRGLRVLLVRTDRADNLAFHEKLNRAVIKAAITAR